MSPTWLQLGSECVVVVGNCNHQLDTCSTAAVAMSTHRARFRPPGETDRPRIEKRGYARPSGINRGETYSNDPRNREMPSDEIRHEQHCEAEERRKSHYVRHGGEKDRSGLRGIPPHRANDPRDTRSRTTAPSLPLPISPSTLSNQIFRISSRSPLNKARTSSDGELSPRLAASAVLVRSGLAFLEDDLYAVRFDGAHLNTFGMAHVFRN